MSRHVPPLWAALFLACGGAAQSPPSPRTEPPLAPAPTPASATDLPSSLIAEPAPQYSFPSADRRAKLATAYAAIDEALAKRAKDSHAPGLAFGLAVDGEIVHVFHYGIADKTTGAKVDGDTRFRLGSISKTFTGLSLAKLRDAGTIASLDVPVAAVLPEAKALRPRTTDAGVVRIRDLLLHHSGLAQNGDYDQTYPRAVDRAELLRSVDLPPLAAPFDRYAYSNFGYGLLGLAIESASGLDYPRYVEQELLNPLGLASHAWSSEQVPAAHRARSYAKDGSEEPEWRLGKLAASGGLFLNIQDLVRWTAFHAQAFPARNDPDLGPVRRATIRELLAISTADAPDEENRTYVHTELGWDNSRTCGERIVWKSGLVEGFISQAMFLPDHGIAFASVANTKMSLYAVHADVLAALRATGGLEPRRMDPSAELSRAMDDWLTVFNDFSSERYESVYSPAFRQAARSSAEAEAWTRNQAQRVGRCAKVGADRVDGARAGRFQLRCERANVLVTLTLTPDARYIASSYNQWKYLPTSQQLDATSEALTRLMRGRRVLNQDVTEKQRQDEKDTIAELKKRGPCVVDKALETSAAADVLIRARCKDATRLIRFRFGDTEQTVKGIELEAEPGPKPACKSW